MYEGEIANLAQEVNLGPDLKLEEEEQRTGLLSVIVVFFSYRLFFMQNAFFL